MEPRIITQEEIKKLDFVPIEQTRPIWKFRDFFTEKWKEFPVTFMICQKNTKHLIQLALESLLRFYPDVNILVVDDDSNDDSKLYLQYKELVTPNLKVWYKDSEYLGHGGNMHQAIMNHIETEYVMMMDSDVIIERGGFLEEMLGAFENNSKLYAIGTLQISSYKNNGGEPESSEDVVRYANPQMSLVHVPTYKELDAPFILDGTPCILNMKAARDIGLDVNLYPTDFFITHNSGSSWTEPRTVWTDDHDVYVRPFLTIVMDSSQGLFSQQTDTDYDVVYSAATAHTGSYTFTDGTQPFEVNSFAFPVRFNVHGEYVVEINSSAPYFLAEDFVHRLKLQVIEEKAPDEIIIDGLKCTKRRVWQRNVR